MLHTAAEGGIRDEGLFFWLGLGTKVFGYDKALTDLLCECVESVGYLYERRYAFNMQSVCATAFATTRDG